MKSVRKRLTYANVMSSLAVFLVLGGATAFAAGQLGKNTVGVRRSPAQPLCSETFSCPPHFRLTFCGVFGRTEISTCPA